MRARPVGVSRSAWLVDCPGHEGWMVKKVSVSRRGCNIPTELENCDALGHLAPRDKSRLIIVTYLQLSYGGGQG